MTHTVDEALAVHDAWEVGAGDASGRAVDVAPGVGRYQRPDSRRETRQDRAVPDRVLPQLRLGQWRYYGLEGHDPQTVDWEMFLGTEQGLAPDQPFNRARYAQWRCYWDFGAGMYTDLFVHRTTSMLKATGVRFPGRVVGGGGIFMEYDGRDVPDVATVVADYDEGVQGLVTATMCSGETPIRSHPRASRLGGLGTGEEFSGYDFVAERPQVTHDRHLHSERIEIGPAGNTSLTTSRTSSMPPGRDKPELVNCSPELGAAAMTLSNSGAKSYREGKAFHFDPSTMSISDGNASWARRWEAMSQARSKPRATWRVGTPGIRGVC